MAGKLYLDTYHMCRLFLGAYCKIIYGTSKKQAIYNGVKNGNFFFNTNYYFLSNTTNKSLKKQNQFSAVLKETIKNKWLSFFINNN